jgi:hypothetical protein
MKTIRYTFLILLFLVITSTYSQVVTYGVTFPNNLQAGNSNLTLNGTGVRKKHMIELYVAGLYTSAKTSNPNDVIDGKGSVAMKIHVLSSMITNKKMSETMREGFEKSTHGNMAPYQDRIDQFVKALSEDVHKGANYDVVYNADRALTQVIKDGQVKSEIKGEDFRKILFAIWLGDDPVDKDLKAKLLGTNP